MNSTVQFIRREWGMILLMVAVSLWVGSRMNEHAHQVDRLVEAYLVCTNGLPVEAVNDPDAAKRCIQLFVVKTGERPVSPTDASTTDFVEVEVQIKKITRNAIIVDAWIDRDIVIPFSVIRDKEEARELQEEEFAEIEIAEWLAMNEGLI